MVFTNVVNPRSHVIRKDEYKTTVVRRGASLGANCTVVCGTTIGRYAFVGAGSVVTRDIPDYALVYGNPGRVRGWMCSCGIGLEFNGGGRGKCKACAAEYVKSGEQQVEPMAVK
jgi:UDP-2-acetamido-3-amino-2,3-dideoxy-glucuronate N-acetyltransferase